MTRRRHLTLIALLGIVGLLGVALAAVAQLGARAALMQYEQRLAQIDKNDPNALYDLAKWAYQNGLKDEALKLAIEANAKAPDDVRPKFLAWAVTAANLTAEETAGAETPAVPTISDDEVQAVFKREGAGPMNGFRRVQGALISSCARTGCHVAENPDAPFTLIRTGVSTDKMLVQNFLAINKYLNREKPDESRLLLKPLTGERKHPKKFSAKTDLLFRSISTWIDSLLTEADQKVPWGKQPPAPPPVLEQE
jgi:tetratricopeptide (TPR) repeat protein